MNKITSALLCLELSRPGISGVAVLSRGFFIDSLDTKSSARSQLDLCTATAALMFYFQHACSLLYFVSLLLL